MALKTIEDDRICAAVALPNLQSIVYELIMNSIEAEATTIQISIYKDKLVCKDDGKGIMDMSFIGAIGATSKENHKGSALAAMHTLCELEIISKCSGESLGKRWKNGTMEACPFNNGTQVTLNNIYHNLIVRQKYLRQNLSKEISKCSELINSFSLLYPIEFILDKYINDKKTRVLTIKKEEKLLTRLKSISSNIVPIEFPYFNGYISTQEVDKSFLCLSYNNEPMLVNFEKHNTLILFKKLIKELYSAHNMSKYLVVLYITNENQFLTEKVCKQLVQDISEQLTDFQTSQNLSSFQTQSLLSSDFATVTSVTSDQTLNNDVRVLGPANLIKEEQKINTIKSCVVPFEPCCSGLEFNEYESYEDNTQHQLDISDFKEMEIIGQFNLGFILCLFQSKYLYIVDQHASHEIYTFENLLTNLTIDKYPLLSPKELVLNSSELLLLKQHQSILESFGFQFIEDNDIYLTVMPVINGVSLNENDLFEMLDKLENGHFEPIPSKLRSKMASRACRTSIMIGDTLNKSEMAKIVHNLSTLNKPWACPHGRPTIKLLRQIKQ